MPNSRLRQIYLAMMQVRMLARALPARRHNGGTLGIEACLVSPAIDLGVGDLISDALGGGVVDFLRGAKLADVLGSGSSARGRGVTVGCGEAARLPYTPAALERIWVSLGAAAASKAEFKRVQTTAKLADTTAAPAGVAVVYAGSGELTQELWRKPLEFARENELPALFVVLPPARKKGHLAKIGELSAWAIRHGVPGIAVDAEDAVALYRVAQESIGHARSGGGPALMECVPFMPAAKASKRKPGAGAIAGLEEYMLQHGVATRAWIEREAKSFTKRIGAARSAASRT